VAPFLHFLSDRLTLVAAEQLKNNRRTTEYAALIDGRRPRGAGRRRVPAPRIGR
jgi:hypothetical protein